tara:strand:- start:115 stop:1053 length:939 start_codon:yes stop_codon:yes gene_type:complete
MYKNGKYWYTSLMVNGKRHTASLRTKDKKIALTRVKQVQNDLYNQIVHGKKDTRKSALSTIKLLKKYQVYKRKNGDWSYSTQGTNKHVLTKWYREKGITATNKATIKSQSKILNGFFNWSNKRYKVNFKTFPINDYEGYGRIRVFNKEELDLLFTSKEVCMWGKYKDSVSMKGVPSVIPKIFLQFAYYTGARQGELLNIESIQDNFMIACGKRDRRVIKLTSQAKKLIENVDTTKWRWEPYHITQAFGKYTKKIGIEDAMFKDLRRTFGFEYLLQGGDIFKLSKLLGHKNIKTTISHYAPLMAVHVPDFEFI